MTKDNKDKVLTTKSPVKKGSEVFSFTVTRLKKGDRIIPTISSKRVNTVTGKFE